MTMASSHIVTSTINSACRVQQYVVDMTAMQSRTVSLFFCKGPLLAHFQLAHQEFCILLAKVLYRWSASRRYLWQGVISSPNGELFTSPCWPVWHSSNTFRCPHSLPHRFNTTLGSCPIRTLCCSTVRIISGTLNCQHTIKATALGWPRCQGH